MRLELHLLLSSALAISAIALPSRAEEAIEEDRLDFLEEIVVTAEKRENTLQDTPISLAAFTAADLENQRIENISDLQAKVPNLQMTVFPTSNQTLRLVIRGIGLNDVQVTQDPSVGVYMNGVYIARSTGLALDVAELERIEVLRGPQGTLYGRNATGGAINLITSPPNFSKFGFKQTLDFGNNNYWRSRTQFNVPIGDTLAFKLAYLRSSRDGFMVNDGPGANFGDTSGQGVRFDLRWLPTDIFKIDYAFDYSDVDTANHTYQSAKPKALTGTTSDPLNQAASSYTPHRKERFWSLATNVPLKESNFQIFGHALTLTWDIGDDLTFKSITAYRELKEDQYADLGSGSTPDFRLDNGAFLGFQGFDLPGVNVDLEQNQWSQEFQLLGDWGDSVEYILGAYFFHEEASQDSFPLHGQIFVDNAFGPYSFLRQNAEAFEIENEALALFGRTTWTPPILEERFHVTVGLRYTRDDRKAKRQAEVRDTVGTDPPTVLPSSFTIDSKVEDDFGAWTPSLILAYDWMDDLNTYFKIERGYKTGGFNTRAGSQEDFENGFDEETLLAYELGAKGSFFDRRLRASAAFFYYDYDDIQMNIQVLGSTTLTNVFNAGKASMYGGELDLTALLFTGMVMTVNYGYLSAEYDEVDDGLGNDISDEFVFANAPDHSFRVGLDYTYPLDFGFLGAIVNYSWVGDRSTTAIKEETERGAYIDAYDLLDARLTLGVDAWGAGELRFSLWGKNLLDNDYPVSAISSLPQSDRGIIWGDPRTYGFETTYEF